jgi:phytoene desaturase
VKKASVIGAGIGGLAIAVRLAVNGYKVSVFESNSYPGGKAAEFKTKGFRFDKGPSLLTMPEKIDELFLLAGRTPRDYFKYSKINESCRYFYEDGTVIKAYSDVMKFSEELFNQTKTPKHQTINYLKENEFIF